MPTVASDFTFAVQRRVATSDPRSMPALVQLNAVTSPIFAGIGRSPVPVLLPFDAAAYVEGRRNGGLLLPISRYQADFRPVDLFDAGPSGYDAVFSLEPGAGAGMPQRTFSKPVEVQITGSLLTYDVDDPAGGKGEPVKSLASQYPDLRRFIREGYVRYAFTRFGVPYVVSIQCLDIDAARAAPRLPRGLPRRRAFPESLACGGRTPGTAARRPAHRSQRTAVGAFARFHLPFARQHHHGQRLSQAVRSHRSHRLFANPLSAGGACLRAFAAPPHQRRQVGSALR